MSTLLQLELPIVQAPMAGGPSTPALAAAVSNAGALGFVAAGYLPPGALVETIAATRHLTANGFGVNIFSPGGAAADVGTVQVFARRLAPLARAAGIELGAPRFDDDHYDDKLAVVVEMQPAVVSFAFGCPTRETVGALHDAGIEAWVTVTDEFEAAAARAVHADVVVAQGSEAGAHRGSFVDDDSRPQSLAELIGNISGAFANGATEPPAIVGAGGIMTGADIDRVLTLGANAVQLGTAFLLCPEAGTSAVHRRAVGAPGETILTRAFTGRRARGIVNAWTNAYDDAPRAYPEIHHLTAPLRAHGREVDNPDLVNLWAGVGHEHARAVPAAELLAELAREIGKSLRSR